MKLERIGNRIVCTFGGIEKTVVIPEGNHAEVVESVVHQISARAKEAERHMEFVRAKKEGREHRNPKFLYEHQAQIDRAEIEQLLNRP